MSPVAIQFAPTSTATSTTTTTKMLVVASMELDSCHMMDVEQLTRQQNLQLDALQTTSVEEGPSEDDLKLASQVSCGLSSPLLTGEQPFCSTVEPSSKPAPFVRV
jgi:hypothetical protein